LLNDITLDIYYLTHMQTYLFKDHFLELKSRLGRVIFTFIITFIICYYYKDSIYNLLLQPLADLDIGYNRKVIYTGLTEAFFTYLKLAAFGASMITIPVLAVQIYFFLKPGLYENEKLIAAFILLLSPVLFWSSSILVFYLVMPKAWSFFLSFESGDNLIPIVLEARISEYLNLIIQLVFAFGLSFQLPLLLVVMNLMKIVTVEGLKKKRRLAIVINFIIAGILTPPDIISQFALAIPLILLYEISIIMCKFVENRGPHARHTMD